MSEKLELPSFMQSVEWIATGKTQDGDLPVSTHEGVFNFGGVDIRCYRLSNGDAVFNADDFKKVFGEFLS